jgi:hypothetical protein
MSPRAAPLDEKIANFALACPIYKITWQAAISPPESRGFADRRDVQRALR